MFDTHNHLHAFTTVLGTLGGFQSPPSWFKALSTTSIWQVLMATVLVYQGGGNLDFVYSLVVALVFYVCVNLSNYIEFGAAEEEKVEVPVEQVEINEETVNGPQETFYGY